GRPQQGRDGHRHHLLLSGKGGQKVTIDIMGKVAQMQAKIKAELPSRAFRAANELRNASLEVLSGSRSGRHYRGYTASAPGEPPAVRTGALRMSWKPITSGAGGVNPAIESGVPYAWLDEGSPGGMIAPRPYAKKIVETAMPAIEAIYAEPYHL
ncbi:MAG: hypothetical protein IJ649_08050, partial [Oscillospiraceae bacterium]|nr:hypothetical protein [Oscillospiraceae bacterium]